jgi:hypothetical protein
MARKMTITVQGVDDYEIGVSSDEDGSSSSEEAALTLLMKVTVKAMKCLMIKHKEFVDFTWSGLFYFLDLLHQVIKNPIPSTRWPKTPRHFTPGTFYTRNYCSWSGNLLE